MNIIKSLNKLSSSESFVEEDVNITKDIINFFLLFKNILFNNYKFIFLFTFLIVFFTMVYVSFLSPSIYKTTMTILPINSEQNEGAIGGLASQFGVNLSQSSNNLSSARLIPDLIKSKSLLSSLLNLKLKFSNKKEKVSLIEHYFGLADSLEINREFYTTDGVDKISSNISVVKERLMI